MKKRILLLSLMAVVLARPSRADTVTLTPIADALTFSDSTGVAFGAQNSVGVRQSAQNGVMWAYLRFDLQDLQDAPGPIPAGSVVTSANLQLYLDNSAGQSPFPVQLYSVNQAWSESSITWSNRPPPDTLFTTTSIQPTNAYVTWSATTLVQEWFNGPRTNQGLVLLPGGTDEMYLGFWSRESATNPPQLVITYTPPQLPPTITTQPQSQTVTEGDQVTFSVTATGTPPLSYQWRYDGAAIGGATNSSYMIAGAQTNHAGTYGAVIANPAGQAVSSNAVLTVLSRPPTSFRILATHVAADGKLSVDYPSDAVDYFILLRGTNVFQINQPVTMKLGANLVDSLAEAAKESSPMASFYRLHRVPLGQPLDSDGDGIDDVYELHSNFLNPLDKADGARDFDSDGASNSQEYRLGTDLSVPNTLINAIILAKTNFCQGEEVDVLVATHDPLGGSNFTSVIINGVPGDHQYLRFTGLAGRRMIHVAASTEEGFIESRLIPINIDTNPPCQVVTFHKVSSAINLYHPYTVDFVIANASDLGAAGQAFVWDFGDGHSQTTTVPTASHDYEAATDDAKPYYNFNVTVSSVTSNLQTRHVFALMNNYYYDKKRGIIQPRVITSGVMQRQGDRMVGQYSLRNLEPAPIQFTQAFIEYKFADEQSPSQYAAVAPGDILFQGGFDEKILNQQQSTNPIIRYAQLALAQQTTNFPNVAVIPGTNTHRASWKPRAADVPAGTTVMACHLVGNLAGQTNAAVFASLFFEVAPSPQLVQPVSDSSLRNFLRELVNRGWVSNPNDISWEDLRRLQREGKIQRQPTGWEIR